MLQKSLLSAALAIIMSASGYSNGRDYINIVGSSTVFPFAAVAAETFHKKTTLPTPKIEATGSGGGMKLFCQGEGVNTPDIVNTSRRIKNNELQKCQKNGVSNITEVLVGFDGIAIANAIDAPTFALTLRDLYLSLAARVPALSSDKFAGNVHKKNALIANPFTHWNQINNNLPNVKIRIIGPPPTSGTRDALQALAIEGGCQTYAFIRAIKKTNKDGYKKLCHTIREDSHYVEVGENDNLIISKLSKDKTTLGIFGFSFLDQNNDKVKGAMINNKAITFENIASGAYPVSRPLYFYIKNSHRNKIKGLNEFIAEFVSEDALGEEGYLIDKGLIPAEENVRNQFAEDAKNANILKL